ncbi:MAG: lipid-A-disaccharide synthase [Bdellovibrionales bacterium]
MTDAPLFFLIAGEASGDVLGARLMAALKDRLSGQVRFVGIGGPRMVEQGLELFFPQSELAHFGVFELVRHLPRLLRRIDETVKQVRTLSPLALITIDSPDFCFRVARRLKGEGIPLIHYVAPSVWVWRKGRAKKIARFLDHLLALLPFEPPHFTCEGLPCTFVGHSIVESGAGQGSGLRYRARYGLDLETPLLTILPGSRAGEVARLMPIFKQAVDKLVDMEPGLVVALPAAPGFAEALRAQTRSWAAQVIVTEGDEDKYDAFAACRAALACSGTVSVELALGGVPSVTVYKVNTLTALLFWPFLAGKFANLVNIMHKRMVVSELIQFRCTPRWIVHALDRMLHDEQARKAQIDGLRDVAVWLGQGKGQLAPSRRAAEAILAAIARKSGSGDSTGQFNKI